MQPHSDGLSKVKTTHFLNARLVLTLFLVDFDRFFFSEVNQWKEHESTCGNRFQSPINLKLGSSQMVDFPKFVFKNYDKSFQEMVSNTGHSGNNHNLNDDATFNDTV